MDQKQDWSGSRSESRSGSWGWRSLRPRSLQVLNSPGWALFFLSVASFLQGLVINGLVNTVVTTIERRFGLSSEQSGLMVSSFDMASCLSLPLVSFCGGRGHRPRWLGWGVLVLGVGSLLFALPHFTAGPYQASAQDQDQLCSPNRTGSGSGSGSGSDSGYVYVFVLGQLLHGLGATPLLTLGFTFLDENVAPPNAPLYMGLFYTAAMLGPSVGLLLGGYFLSFYSEVTNTTDLSPSSPLWVGAWWIGFVLGGALCLPVGLFLLGFPSKLPGSPGPGAKEPREERPREERPREERPREERPREERPREERPREERPNEERPREERPREERPHEERPREERPHEERPREERPHEERPREERPREKRPHEERPREERPHEERPREERPHEERPREERPHEERPREEKALGRALRDMPKSLVLLLKNPTFLCLSLAGAAMAGLRSVLGSFTPKYYEAQFRLSSSQAALICGMASFPATVGGSFGGSFVVKVFRLRSLGIIRFCLLCSVANALLLLVFLIHCPTARLAGVTAPYAPDPDQDQSLQQTRWSLQLWSQCNGPCSCDGQVFSPVCGDDDLMFFSPCFAGCSSSNSSSGKQLYSDCRCIVGNVSGGPEAAAGPCPSSCHRIPLFAVLVTTASVFMLLLAMPAITATLRCVAEEDKSFALGIQWILGQTLGAIPGPIVVGALIDQACLLQSEGSCLLYENSELSHFMVIASMAYAAAGAVFFTLALVFQGPPPETPPLPEAPPLPDAPPLEAPAGGRPELQQTSF